MVIKLNKYITLNNEFISLKINCSNAQMTNLCHNNKEYLWQADPKSWNNTAPVLFPICGRLWDNKYIYNNKEYELGLHGFIRFADFKIENITEESVIFSTCQTEKTKLIYPFDFIFKIIYEIKDKTVNIKYLVENSDNKTMYFSTGGHEGYFCPKGIENYSLEFPNDDFLVKRILDNGYFTGDKKIIPLENHKLALKYDEFTGCACVLNTIKSKYVVLSGNDRKIKVDLGTSTCLAIWTIKDCEYLCIEPWNGCSESGGKIKSITEKEGIIALKSNEKFTHSHSITILE